MLDNLISDLEHCKERPLLVVYGCPRSGTKFTSKVLQSWGWDVGHEEWGKDGIAAWYLADPITHLTPRYQEHTAGREIVSIHQVRDPLRQISSNSPRIAWHWAFINEFTSLASLFKRGENEMLLAARFWVQWNLLAEMQRPHYRVRVEDIPAGRVPTNTNTGKDRLWKDGTPWIYSVKRQYDWGDLKCVLPEDLLAELSDLTVKYGYEGGPWLK